MSTSIPPPELFDDDDQHDQAADSVAELVADVAPKSERAKSRSVVPPARRDKWAREAERMRETRDWTQADPGHVVALFAWCHLTIYGVEDVELQEGRRYAYAVQAARLAIKRDHGGDVAGLVELVRWTWAREKGRERWRRERNDGQGGKMSWRLQFSGAIATDWRLDRVRKGQPL